SAGCRRLLLRAPPATELYPRSLHDALPILGDGGHHAHLEQRLDHVAALQRKLLRQVGHGDRVADRHFAHDRRGGPGETAARTRLLGMAAGRLGLAAAAAAAPRAVGGAQVHLAGETAGALVVLDPGDHRMRTAGLVLVAGLVVGAGGRRLGMPVAMALADRKSVV